MTGKTRFQCLWTVSCVLLPLFIGIRPAEAAPQAKAPTLKLTGYLGAQGPIGFDPEKYEDRSPQAIGGLLLGGLPVGCKLSVDSQFALRKGVAFDREDKLKVALMAPVGRDVVAFCFWERRWTLDPPLDRVVAGVRFGFTVFGR